MWFQTFERDDWRLGVSLTLDEYVNGFRYFSIHVAKIEFAICWHDIEEDGNA